MLIKYFVDIDLKFTDTHADEHVLLAVL